MGCKQFLRCICDSQFSFTVECQMNGVTFVAKNAKRSFEMPKVASMSKIEQNLHVYSPNAKGFRSS